MPIIFDVSYGQEDVPEILTSSTSLSLSSSLISLLLPALAGLVYPGVRLDGTTTFGSA